MDLLLRVIEVIAVTVSALIQLLSYLSKPDKGTKRDTQ